ncbi:MAG TPA: lipoprotein [Verrucomicrobiae bacterium]|nr:lipoprotein [Verrucomicrobiae bacterium]
MMRKILLAAVAALALSACGQGGSGPALPQVQEGAQAPSVQVRPPGQTQRGEFNEEVHTQLRQNMLEQLNAIGQNFAAGQAPPAGFEDQILTLEPGTDHRWQVSLTGGQPYTFIGACDGDCTNVDIELISVTTGGVVASDMLPDDYPVVQFTPPADGQFIVRTLLQNCTVTPCYVGTRGLTPGAAGAEAPK